MDTLKVCAKCGAGLPADAPRGLCPQCLMEAALAASSETRAANAIPTGTRLRYFGDYELQEKIAHGGMGVVYKARQVSLNRTVAIKMILGGRLAGPADVERFLTEAEAAANLRHPNIVAIHEVGEHDGQHYFSMDYVDGKNLFEYQQLHPFNPTAAARLVKVIAEAVHHAHQRGTLHRDLKPQNVLIDTAGEPHVTDFGLAKLAERDSGLTQTGAVMGSPSYMPPEQATGRRGEVGPPSDVYALGAILYFLLTGQPPFVRETPLETLAAVVNEPVTPPGKVNAGAPRDLETICLKSLEKQPERRYFSARELAEELGRFLNHEPILARPAGRVRRAWNWTQRNPWAMAAALGCVALAMVCLAYGLWERTQFLRWRMEPSKVAATASLESIPSFSRVEAGPAGPAAPAMPTIVRKTLEAGSPAIWFFLALPAVVAVLFAAERIFRKKCRARTVGGVSLPEKLLFWHAAIGVAVATMGLGFLLLQIRCWAWVPIQAPFITMEVGAAACALALNWVGLRMVWEAAGIHESSRFRDVVEKTLERDLAVEGRSWPVGKRVMFGIWIALTVWGVALAIVTAGEKGPVVMILGGLYTAAPLWVLAVAARRRPVWFSFALVPMLLTVGILAWLTLVNSNSRPGVAICAAVMSVLIWPVWVFFGRAGLAAWFPARAWKELGTGAAVFAGLIAFGYAMEDIRGWREWQRTKAELTAKGDTLDWSSYIPPEIPAEQNIFAAPKMQEWFTGRGPNALSGMFDHALRSVAPSYLMMTNNDPGAMARFLAASDELEAPLAIIGQGLQRPLARMAGEYAIPFKTPIPNFVRVRELAQLLAARSHGHLLEGRSGAALADVTLMHQLNRMLDGPPNGQPELLVASMVEVAIVGFYLRSMDDGIAHHAWDESQLLALQSQLQEIDLPRVVMRSVRTEQAAGIWAIQNYRRIKLLDYMNSEGSRLALQLAPRGWIYQNMSLDARRTSAVVEIFHDDKDVLHPERINFDAPNDRSPYQFLAAVALPYFVRAAKTTGETQTQAIQARIVCALERFRLAHGQYPKSLETLVPEYLTEIPHGSFEVQPPAYQRKADGSFTLSCAGSDKERLAWPPTRQ